MDPYLSGDLLLDGPTKEMANVSLEDRDKENRTINKPIENNTSENNGESNGENNGENKTHIESPSSILSSIRVNTLLWQEARMLVYEGFDFPPAEKIKEIGIQGTKVNMSRGNTLQFEPCYFLPYHEENILERYPIQAGEEISPLKPTPPSFDVALRSARDYAFEQDEEWIQGYAQRLYQKRLERFKEGKGDYGLSIPRIVTQEDPECNIPSLDGLLGLTHWRFEKRERLMVQGEWTRFWGLGSRLWSLDVFLRYFDPDQPKPHLIALLESPACASDGDQGICYDEIEASLALMIHRAKRPGFRNYGTHPILILSFLGSHHVRILQVSFDQKNFLIQYSQLWDCWDEENPPTDILLRYCLSQPVGLVA
ncbi:hypothetical protein N7481_000273 [Penicillium waksmanii]|uniref:uncharacterized protein n=1 Tax=Penicillium waksmanii TaxID=69791 RepID=UPI002547DC99|nr:uncharacterized protein N7481_000273 [Penicillium waksmanii]KAJ5999864.1 hypothetical protein N7481_000273 [Penicillium waksmanii]